MGQEAADAFALDVSSVVALALSGMGSSELNSVRVGATFQPHSVDKYVGSIFVNFLFDD